MSASGRRLRRVLAPSCAAALSGCVPYALFQGTSATLQPSCGQGAFAAYAEVGIPHGPVQYNGHMLGFDRAEFQFTVWLPELPKQARRFAATEIEVKSTPTLWHLTGGSVEVDAPRHLLSVQLQVDGHPFEGNGRFAIEGEPRQCAATP